MRYLLKPGTRLILSFGSDYFKKIFYEFQKNPKLGIASDVSLVPHKDRFNLQPATALTRNPLTEAESSSWSLTV